MEESGKPNISDFFPILRLLDPQRVQARLASHMKKVHKIFDGIIEDRICSRNSKADYEVCNDVLDSLLNSNNLGETTSELSRNEMLHLFQDLFVAGTDTTSSTIEWIMVELLRNPEKLTKARKELCEVIGKDETIEESHISKLPFLQAVVKETLRLHPAAPLLLPRKCDENANILGFNVPKNVQVFVNVWAMGRDPTIWENPTMFMPERFLECDINYKGSNFELIPFGAGKRICPGLPLAHRTMHLIVASLLRNFEWTLADGLKPEDMNMDEKFGLTLRRVESLRVQATSSPANSFLTNAASIKALSSNKYHKVGGQDDLKPTNFNKPETSESRSNQVTELTGKELRKPKPPKPTGKPVIRHRQEMVVTRRQSLDRTTRQCV
ncbi:hypothetical protein TSUD_160230 [Trifolium subterraneum]|uniref:Cytochrome P450 n=1 Tax=Trifolium subterraneum TaxID=3900 RepID=A0A2Z6M8U0_TRISU|nr:hypothetical protein TSUD_160230 [Trifolium subterraneum]